MGKLALINEDLGFLNAIKGLRITVLNYYLSNKMMLPLVKNYITWKQKRNLDDEEKRESTLFDFIYISEKIYL